MLSILEKIYAELGCNIGDIMEFTNLDGVWRGLVGQVSGIVPEAERTLDEQMADVGEKSKLKKEIERLEAQSRREPQSKKKYELHERILTYKKTGGDAMEKLSMQTKDIASENFQKLAALFPNAVTETINEDGEVVRAIDADVLRQEISCKVVEGGGANGINLPGRIRGKLSFL